MERAVDRPPPQQDDIDKAIEQKYNETLKTKKGATCDYLSSISLLNRYCTSLPRDQFTDPLPQWEDISVKGLTQTNFVVKIILPIQSPCKEEIQVSLILFYKINFVIIHQNKNVESIHRVNRCQH